MKLGPGDIFERSHELATQQIIKAKTGQDFGISNKQLKELKTYLKRPEVVKRPARVVYPHEVGQLGRVPELEKIKSNVARKHAGTATMELLEKNERAAVAQGYTKVMGLSHFDPKQLALTGYKETKGTGLVESGIRTFGYGKAKRQIEKQLMTKGHGILNPTKTYFRAVDPKSTRLFIKDISDPAQIGLGSKEVRRVRFAEMKDVLQSKDPAVHAKMKAEKEFNKRYYSLLDDMYKSDYNPVFMAQQKKYRKKKLVRDVAKGGVTAGVSAGTYSVIDEFKKAAEKKKKRSMGAALSDIFNTPSKKLMAQSSIILGTSVVGGLMGGKFGSRFGFAGRLLGATAGATSLGAVAQQAVNDG